MPSIPSQQADFEQKYISAHEIAKLLGVTRQSVHFARKRGALPNPILVGPDMIYIWERAALKPYLDAWADQLHASRGVPA